MTAGAQGVRLKAPTLGTLQTLPDCSRVSPANRGACSARWRGWALAQEEKTGQRFYSMSAQIRRERKEYYALLERTQKGNLDVTSWQDWFLNCLKRAS